MAEKHIITFQQYTQKELTQFLQKNGHSDIVDVLTTAGITNGKEFLNLTELQMIKWKIPLISKRKLINFLKEIKENPEKFIRNEKTERRGSINRRPNSRANNDFLQKLQDVISVPKSESQIPVKKPQDTVNRKRAPTPPPQEPVEINNLPNNDVDSNGYLIPVEPTNFEENEYEPTPSEKMFINFSTLPISQRPPVTLPRNSVDERGYILGPEKPEVSQFQTTFPRVKNINTHLYRPPKNLPTVVVPQVLENDEEDVAYEPVDYGEEETSSISSGSTTYAASAFKISEVHNYENKDIKSDTFRNRNIEIPANVRNRPLPPLPDEQVSQKVLKKEPKFDEPLEAYENIDEINKTSQQILQRMQQKLKQEKFKSESELDSLTYGNVEETGVTYRNTENINLANTNFEENTQKPKHLESYEKVLLSKKIPRKPLPVLPADIPRFNLNISNDLDAEEDENEEYGSFLFNLNNEPFYRNTDRKGARLLLHDLSDGAFLFRPSKRFFLTLSLKYGNNYINLGIEKTMNNRIRLNTTGDNMSPEFPTLSAFVEYFTRESLTFEHQGTVIETYLRQILPHDRF